MPVELVRDWADWVHFCIQVTALIGTVIGRQRWIKLLIFDRRAAHRHTLPPESSDSEGSGLIALIRG